MKNVYTLFICIALLLLLASCGKKEGGEDSKGNKSSNGLNLKKGLLNVYWDNDRNTIKTKYEKYPPSLISGNNNPDIFQYKGGSICGFTVSIWTFRFNGNGGKLCQISTLFDSKTIDDIESAFVKLKKVIIDELGQSIEKKTNYLNKSAEWNVVIDPLHSIRVFLKREANDFSPNETLFLEVYLNNIDTSYQTKPMEYHTTNNLVDTTVFGLLSYGMTVNQVKELGNIYVLGLSDFNYNYGKVYSLQRKKIFFGDSAKLLIYFDPQETVKNVTIMDFSLCSRKTAKGTYLPSITNEGKSEIKRIKSFFTRLYGVPSVKDTNLTEWFAMSTTTWHSSSSDIDLHQEYSIENHKKMEMEFAIFLKRKY